MLNAAIIRLASQFSDGFEVGRIFWTGIFATLGITAVNIILSMRYAFTCRLLPIFWDIVLERWRFRHDRRHWVATRRSRDSWCWLGLSAAQELAG